MVLITIGGILVFPETIVLLVVVVVGLSTGPVGRALDTEVIIAFAGQEAISVTTFQQPLSKRNARRNTMLLHFCHGHLLPEGDIFLSGVALTTGLRLSIRQARKRANARQHQQFH